MARCFAYEHAPLLRRSSTARRRQDPRRQRGEAIQPARRELEGRVGRERQRRQAAARRASGSAPGSRLGAEDVPSIASTRSASSGRLAEAPGIEGQQEHALIIRPGIGADGARSRHDACERFDQQREREALRATQRLKEPVAHPRLRAPADPRPPARAPCPVPRRWSRDRSRGAADPARGIAGGRRIRGQPALARARRRDGLSAPESFANASSAAPWPQARSA